MQNNTEPVGGENPQQPACPKCPACGSIIYSRRHVLCGVCGEPLREELLFPVEQREKIAQELKDANQRTQATLARDAELVKQRGPRYYQENREKWHGGSSVGYAGCAAAMVLGVGLIAIGGTWIGLAIILYAGIMLGISMSPTEAGKAFFISLGAIICAGLFAYNAASNEFTGKADYITWLGRHPTSEAVTRESSPEKFRQATNLLWAGGICAFGVAAVSFIYYRRSED